MVINLVLIFVSYLFGRWSHVYLNTWTGNVNWWPHHWILGALMMIIGYFGKGVWGQRILCLGLGLFVSDFNDFLHFRTFQPDGSGLKIFWGID